MSTSRVGLQVALAAWSIVVLTTAAAAAPRDTVLVSLYQGAQLQYDADSVTLSADGRWVAFVAQHAHRDIFLYDRATGETVYVTEGADDDSARPAISADGRYVAFETYAENLAAGASSWFADVVVYDRVSAAFTRASVADDGTPANNGGYQPAISADGRFVAFASESTNLSPADPYAMTDVYVRDLVAGTTVLASSRQDGSPGGSFSYDPSISANGTTVAFTSQAAFDANDVRDCNTEYFIGSCPDVYVKNLASGEIAWASSTGGGGDGSSWEPSISGDGRFVAFSSTSGNLVDADTNEVEDVFVHDLVAATTWRVSLASDGTQAGGASTEPMISEDGAAIVFTSAAANLTTYDTNEATDVFLHDRLSGTTTRVSISSAGVEGDSASDGPAIAATGIAVAFSSSASNLVDVDWNGAVRDVFVHEPDDRVPTVLVYHGDTEGRPNETVAVSASLADATTGDPLAAVSLEFRLVDGDTVLTAAWCDTDSAGLASTTMVLPQQTGTFDMVALHSGSPEYAPSASAIAFTVARDATATSYVGDESGVPDTDAYVAARVTDAGTGAAIESPAVMFVLKQGQDVVRQTSGWSGPDGLVSASLRLDVQAGEYTLEAVYEGDAYHEPSSDSRPFLVQPLATSLVYEGTTAGLRHETVSLSARLTEDGTGDPLPGRNIDFTLALEDSWRDQRSAWTDENGVAAIDMPLDGPAGAYTLEATLRAGRDLEPANVTVPFTIDRHPTTIAYSGPAEIVRDQSAILEARLARTAGDLPLVNHRVQFELLQGEEPVWVFSQWTAADGIARGELPQSIPPGEYAVRAVYPGDDEYAASSDAGQLRIRLLATTTSYEGASSGFQGEHALVSAHLVDESGNNLVGRPVYFRLLGGNDVLQSTTANTDNGGVAAVPLLLDVPAGDHVIEATFEGEATLAGSTATAPFSVRQYETALTFTGPTQGVCEETVTMAAHLAVSSDGDPIPGERVLFRLVQAGIVRASTEAVSDQDGDARAALRIEVPSGAYQIEAEFPGRLAFAPSSVTSAFAVARRATTTTYGGAVSGTFGERLELSATLARLNDGVGIGGRRIDFDLSSASGVLQTAHATTDAAGLAITSFELQQPAGDYQVRARFEGDAFFAVSSGIADLEISSRTAHVVAMAPASGKRGERVSVTGSVMDGVTGAPLAGKMLRFTLGSFSTDAASSADGTASVELTLGEAPGAHTIYVSFAGDGFYAAAQASAAIDILWEYTFVDDAGAGTIYLNPSTKEFQFVSPYEDSGIRHDPAMRVARVNNHAVTVTASAGADVTLTGTFELGTGRFQATVSTRTRSYVLRHV